MEFDTKKGEKLAGNACHLSELLDFYCQNNRHILDIKTITPQVTCIKEEIDKLYLMFINHNNPNI